jgi:hypothetical protein
MANASFTGLMANSTGYGASAQLDIMNNTCPYGTPQNGTWMVSLATAGGLTDAFTTMLSAALVSGSTYSMSFWDRGDPNYPPGVPIIIGLSTVAGAPGTAIYTGPVPLNGPWSQRTFTFVAPNNGQHISISTTGAPLWTFVDNFCLGAGCIPLPVELVNFSGTCNGGTIELNWNTQTETNNSYFNVERWEGDEFIVAQKITGKGSNSYYTYREAEPTSKYYYYRLAQHDNNGEIHYSEIISVDPCKNKMQNSFVIYPNPAKETVCVLNGSQLNECTMTVVNNMGEVVKQKNIDRGTNSVDVSDLPSGIYFVRVAGGDEEFTKKIIKE